MRWYNKQLPRSICLRAHQGERCVVCWPCVWVLVIVLCLVSIAGCDGAPEHKPVIKIDSNCIDFTSNSVVVVKCRGQKTSVSI